jgi:exodeoxyribonuclease-3
MHIATWNVNSIRARKDRLLAWLAAHRPEVVCLQETKVVDDDFPAAEVETLGYRALTHGQRTYNGVAVLTSAPHGELVQRGLPGDAGAGPGGTDDAQARFLDVAVRGARVLCCYVPQGQSVGSDKFAYKLAWLGRLRAYLGTLDPGAAVALCGDLNVALEDRDVHDPAAWRGEVMCTDEERAALRELLSWGLSDTLRLLRPDAGIYTWWDYRNLAFPFNKGLRIDHVLVTNVLGARCTDVRVDRNERKGKGASDHVPVVATFTD